MSLNFHIYLYRAKFIKPRQLPLDFLNLSSEDIFKMALSETPSITTKEGYSWHFGNLTYFNDISGFFRIGRQTESALPKYDDVNKIFFDEPSDTSPNTIVYFETSLGILGITRKYSLSPSDYGIAQKIQQLLQSTETISMSGVHVEIDAIKNPVSFINRIKSAYSVKRFTVTFGGPNPFDADEHFQKPMSVYLQDANGVEGKTIIDGPELNQEVLIRMTHSVAATGNDATARVQDTLSEKVVTVYMRNNPAKVVVSKQLDQSPEVIAKILNAYKEVRNI